MFAGSFSLEAAEAICAGEPGEACDVFEVLSSLIDKSLVLMEQRSGEARYRLLETMRQYGQEKLQQAGEVAAVRSRHGDWYVRFAERAGPESGGLQQTEWFRRVELEHDNIRTALAWSLEQAEAEPGPRIDAAIWHFWLFRGYLTEGRNVLERILQHFSEQHLYEHRSCMLPACWRSTRLTMHEQTSSWKKAWTSLVRSQRAWALPTP